MARIHLPGPATRHGVHKRLPVASFLSTAGRTQGFRAATVLASGTSVLVPGPGMLRSGSVTAVLVGAGFEAAPSPGVQHIAPRRVLGRATSMARSPNSRAAVRPAIVRRVAIGVPNPLLSAAPINRISLASTFRRLRGPSGTWAQCASPKTQLRHRRTPVCRSQERRPCALRRSTSTSAASVGGRIATCSGECSTSFTPTSPSRHRRNLR